MEEKKNSTHNTKVSIFLLTYNQEKYIAQTIESILSQQTNFSFQLVIGEDCSSDSTRTICESYAIEYGNKIKLLPALENNIGLIKNYMRTIKECDGKYIAICDGDDYWIDEFKLQKQVSILEANENCKIVHTDLKVLCNGKFENFYKQQKTNEFFLFDNLIASNPISSVTVMFRNFQQQEQLPLWVNNHPYGDYPTYLWILRNGGYIHYLDEVTSVYRKDIGVSSKLEKSNNYDLSILKDLYNDSNFSLHKPKLRKKILQKYFEDVNRSHNEFKYFKGFIIFFSLFLKNKFSHYLVQMYLSLIKKELGKHIKI